MPIYDRQTNKINNSTNNIDRIMRLENKVSLIISRMMENENLIKLMVRNKSDVLDDPTPVTDKERSDMKDLILDNPTLNKDEEITNKIVMDISDIVPMEVGLAYSVTFNILCSADSWTLDSYVTRPLAILNQLDNILTDTTINAWGRVEFLGASSLRINERLNGYTASFIFGEI